MERSILTVHEIEGIVNVLLRLAMTAVATAPLAVVPPGSAEPRTGDDSSASYIVVLDRGVGPVRHGRAHDVRPDRVYRRAVNGYAADLSPDQVADLEADGRVALVQRDETVRTMGQTVPFGIDRANAERSSARAGSGSGSTDVDVAVIDTGVDLDHADLNVNRSGARNCTTAASADDGNGHGTHVAGTIGARDDTKGVVGVAPGARIWPVRVLGSDGTGTFSSIICGLDYVAAHADEIEVANLSLGGSGSDDRNCGYSNGDALHRAVCNAVARGVTVVAAAGNASTNAATSVPASYDEVITVSALADFDGRPGGGAAATCRVDVDDTFANFSNYGADVDLIAPGTCVSSTWRGGGYATTSGTSMAAPHVAGGAALYLANHPSATPADVRSALRSAGSRDWNDVDDPDGIKERLLDVRRF